MGTAQQNPQVTALLLSLVPGPAAVFLGASKNADPQASPANRPGLLHFNTIWPLELERHRVASHHGCNQRVYFEFLRGPSPGMSPSSSPFYVAWMRITAGGIRVCTRGQWRLGAVTASCKYPDGICICECLSQPEGRLGGSSGLVAILTQAAL